MYIIPELNKNVQFVLNTNFHFSIFIQINTEALNGLFCWGMVVWLTKQDSFENLYFHVTNVFYVTKLFCGTFICPLSI